MPKYISNEKRADIIFHKKSGKNNKEIAAYMRVCTRTIGRIWKDYQSLGKTEANVCNCGRKSSITEEQKDHIIKEIENVPDVTLNELIKKFELKITEGGLSKYLKKQGFTYKKRQHIQLNKTEKMFKKSEKVGWHK